MLNTQISEIFLMQRYAKRKVPCCCYWKQHEYRIQRYTESQNPLGPQCSLSPKWRNNVKVDPGTPFSWSLGWDDFPKFRDSHVLHDLWTFHSQLVRHQICKTYLGQYPNLFNLHPLILKSLGKSNKIKLYLADGSCFVSPSPENMACIKYICCSTNGPGVVKCLFAWPSFVPIWCRRRSPLTQCLIGVWILWHLLSSQTRSCLWTIGNIFQKLSKRIRWEMQILVHMVYNVPEHWTCSNPSQCHWTFEHPWHMMELGVKSYASPSQGLPFVSP